MGFNSGFKGLTKFINTCCYRFPRNASNNVPDYTTVLLGGFFRNVRWCCYLEYITADQ